jgi:predicted heme/steroid binding protein
VGGYSCVGGSCVATPLGSICGTTGSGRCFYVDSQITDCSNYNPATRICGTGTYQAYNTINEGENAATQPGDIVYVRSGTYDERVSNGYSGTSGNFISFVGYPGDVRPIMRGFELQNKNYIRIIGIEITHISSAYGHAIVLPGCTNIEILDNYIHHIYGQGGAIRGFGAYTSNITIRGNEIDYIACVPGVLCDGNGWAAQPDWLTDHWLVEYNNIHRLGDFVNLYGNHQIVRNNYMYDYHDSYFSAGGGHVDFFQPGSDGADTHTYNHIYESNLLGDNVELNSHVLQMRDTINAGDNEIIFRGNVAYNLGAYALQAGGIDYVRHYNNVFYNMMTQSSSGLSNFRYNVEGGNPSIGNHNFNNIIQTMPLGDSLFSVEGASTLTSSNNLCYNTPVHTSCASTANPLFVNLGIYDFHLQSGSPAIGLGKAITTVTSSSGSGTFFNVVDANFFCDGFGITGGDVIKVGASNPVRIISINGNTITVSSSISWNNGDGVYWRNQDTSPDAGAYEYKTQGYNFDIVISNPTSGSSVNGLVTISTTPTNPENIRFVSFYIDGIPVAQDYESPYSYTWDASSKPSGSTHIIEAKAYNLYASTTLTKSSNQVQVTIA